ncbi:MAG: hypothetical protein IPP93_18445 [Chitinophagaceae bacterium]|nr:hypothetical protein [Chitinophagaceae bacterium]MBL0333899.1 hypothetical protein [Chitinophagaceae bacterium]
MLHRPKPDLDIIMDILDAVLAAKPGQPFVTSLKQQYIERGGLSRKQLEGLYQKAERIENIPTGKLATLEAIIMKKPVRTKSPKPEHTPLYTKDPEAGQLITDILVAFPQHKRVQFFHTKYNNNESLSGAEMTELRKFAKLLLKK